jgi:hypothetical protein
MLRFCFVIGAQKFKDAFEAPQEKVSVKSEKEAAYATECNNILNVVKHVHRALSYGSQMTLQSTFECQEFESKDMKMGLEYMSYLHEDESVVSCFKASTVRMLKVS